ncbi:MAG TPA: peptidyl-prolyl cis-trans isomerase [Thermoanaerobaculia bacterium]
MTPGRAVIALGVLLAACQRSAPPPPDAVARIGDADVRYAEFERYVAQTVGEPGGVLGSDVLSELFDQFLDERLLERLAADRGLLRSSATPGQGRQAIDALLEKNLRQEPGEAEIARYYQAHRQDFARPERVRLRQILTADRKAAEEARRQIAAGIPFEEVSRRLSRGPRADGGGYQGELARGDLPPSFADLIFALKPGEVSPVVPADYGFHLFQVTAREPAEVVPLAAARGEILGKLRRQRADQLLRSLVQEARSHYNVRVYERNLPFAYQGSYSHAQKAR